MSDYKIPGAFIKTVSPAIKVGDLIETAGTAPWGRFFGLIIRITEDKGYDRRGRCLDEVTIYWLPKNKLDGHTNEWPFFELQNALDNEPPRLNRGWSVSK